MVLKRILLGVVVFFISGESALPRSGSGVQKLSEPFFVKKPRLKMQYTFFIKVLSKHAPELKPAFEKAFSWGFRAAKRSSADKQAEDALLDALETDVTLAPAYKEAIFVFSEDMNPSPWGKIILGSIGGITATVVLAATVMWYRDKRQAERERLLAEQRLAAERKQRFLEGQRALAQRDSVMEHQAAQEQARADDLSFVKMRNAMLTKETAGQPNVDPVAVEEQKQLRHIQAELQRRGVAFNKIKELMGIELSSPELEKQCIESREAAIWQAYCKDVRCDVKLREYRDRSHLMWATLDLWRNAVAALHQHLILLSGPDGPDISQFPALVLGILGRLNPETKTPQIFYYVRTVMNGKNNVTFFGADGFEIKDVTDFSHVDFLGRIANTTRPNGNKLTQLIEFIASISAVGEGRVDRRTPLVSPSAGTGAGSA